MFPTTGGSANRGGDELPLVVQTDPIVGYRVWRVSNTSGSLMLRSLSMSYMWKVTNTAECLPPGSPRAFFGGGPIQRHEEDSPGVDCACGFYCQLPDKPISEWESQVRSMVRAVGEVALSGRVIQCERGFKAQHAELRSPIMVEAGCIGANCEDEVTKLVPLPIGQYKGYCADHFKTQTDEMIEASVDAKSWMRVACRELGESYPGIEFVSWYHL